MNKHPYLRAYLAGIAIPTAVLLVVMTVYTIVRYVYAVPVPIERIIVFPMAAVPNRGNTADMRCTKPYQRVSCLSHFPTGHPTLARHAR